MVACVPGTDAGAPSQQAMSDVGQRESHDFRNVHQEHQDEASETSYVDSVPPHTVGLAPSEAAGGWLYWHCHGQPESAPVQRAQDSVWHSF